MSWICDVCGQTIDQADEADLMWFRGVDGELRDGLMLVHHDNTDDESGGCGYNYDQIPDVCVNRHPADAYLGADGLMRLLANIVGKTMPTDETMVMIQRLHIPQYEEALPYMRDAVSRGIVIPSWPDGFFYQSQLEDIISWAKDDQD